MGNFEPPILAEAPLISPTLLDQLPCLAAAAEEQGRAAVACGNDAEADTMFLIEEHTDGLIKALAKAGRMI